MHSHLAIIFQMEMNTSNDWEQNLDEIFRLHESRTEQELFAMSRTIESHTASKDDDITSMTTLFDYMQLRFVLFFGYFSFKFLGYLANGFFS